MKALIHSTSRQQDAYPPRYVELNYKADTGYQLMRHLGAPARIVFVFIEQEIPTSKRMTINDTLRRIELSLNELYASTQQQAQATE